ncbi:MAG: PEGA domain-containing protein [Sandaracinaceae bacterium]
MTVTAGQQRVVSLDMVAEQGAQGRIIVRADVPGATVVIDNEERGTAPVVYAGAGAARGRGAGGRTAGVLDDLRHGAGAELRDQRDAHRRAGAGARGGAAGAHGSAVLIDERPVGPVPFDGTLPAGSHVMAVTAPGYEEYRQQVLLQPSSEVRPFDITLAEMTDGLTENQRRERAEDMERRMGAAMTHGGAPLPEGQASIDISLGWPYLGELRLNVGLHEFVDAGFSIRSFGRLTDFEGRVRVGFRPLEQLGIAGQVRFGGGIGPTLDYGQANGYEESIPCLGEIDPAAARMDHRVVASRSRHWRGGVRHASERSDCDASYPINSAFFSLEAIASLHFGDEGAFALWLGLDVTSDEYAGPPSSSSAFVDYQNDPNTGLVGGAARTARWTRRCRLPSSTVPGTTGLEARLGSSLELRLDRNWNLWFMLEGSSILRRAGSWVTCSASGADTQFYFRIGTTYKF